MRTLSAQPSEIERKWFVVDAEGLPLGRVASAVVSILRGKHRATYTPHVDAGDFVVVVNAAKVALTGNKVNDKQWQRHSGIPGGFKATSYREVLARRPELAIEKAVKGMLPRTPLGRDLVRKLKVYSGPTHPHAAQKPEALAIRT